MLEILKFLPYKIYYPNFPISIIGMKSVKIL